MQCPKPKPLPGGSGYRGCGGCFACRLNRRREWTARIMLERLLHPASFFGTLTYAEEPRTADGDPTLSKRDLTLFLKRYRENVGPFRYFAVGEYGDRTQRPHYHVVIFGHSILEHEEFNKSWKKGFTSVGDLTPSRAAYCASYTIKKLTKEGDNRLSCYQCPEFSLMSRRPGIALSAELVERLASCYEQSNGKAAFTASEDVAHTVRIGGQVMPIPERLRQKVRARLGLPETASELREQLGGAPLERPEPLELIEARKRERKARKRARKSHARIL